MPFHFKSVIVILLMIAAAAVAMEAHRPDLPQEALPSASLNPTVERARLPLPRNDLIRIPTPPALAVPDKLPGISPFLAQQFADGEGEEEAPLSDGATVRGANRRQLRPSGAPPTPRATGFSPTPAASNQIEPLLETFRELQAISQPVNSAPGFGNRIGGVRNPRGGGQQSSSRNLPPSPTSTPEPTPTPERLVGIPTGFTMLYFMHPRARETVERDLQSMLDAQIEDLYLGVLVDGTFDQDFEYLKQAIRRLSADGRRLTLALYLSNGATMRKFDTTPITAAWNRFDPFWFRELIRTDEVIRDEVRALARKVVPIFDLNTETNPLNENIAIVMLEDNLDRESYLAMREVISGVIQNKASFVRNPCPGCFAGNDTFVAPDDGIESHTASDVATLRPMDGFSLDGISYSYPGEPPSPAPSVQEIKELKRKAVERDLRYFGLWRAQRQGLSGTLALSAQMVHPDDRRYEVATPEQAAIDIEMLREGSSFKSR